MGTRHVQPLSTGSSQARAHRMEGRHGSSLLVYFLSNNMADPGAGRGLPTSRQSDLPTKLKKYAIPRTWELHSLDYTGPKAPRLL